MKRLFVFLLVVFFVNNHSVGLAPSQHVVIISIDGLSPKALQMAKAPNIKSWNQLGSSAANAQSVIPAITITNHASMISGVAFDQHKMETCDEEMKVPTIFDLGRLNGLTTVLITAKDKLLCLVDESKLTFYRYVKADADVIANEAIKAFDKLAPNITLIHFREVDVAGHDSGWYGVEQIAAIENVDLAFAKIVDSLRMNPKMAGKTVVILTADHGGHDLTHRDLPEDTWIPWYAVGPGIPAQSNVDGHLVQYDTAAYAANFLGLVAPKEWQWKGRAYQFKKH